MKTSIFDKKTVLVSLMSVLLIVAFGLSSGEYISGQSGGNITEVDVEVGDNYFDPDVIEVEPGEDIVFENIGDIDHTITVEEADIDEVISPGETVTISIAEGGEYFLDCTYHEGHDGMIYVEEEVEDEFNVEVGDNYFDPDVIEVEAGQTIVFENVGNTGHTVTIEGTEYDESISPGETVTVTIEEEGIYDLECTIHAGHDGTIYVGEEAPEDEELPGFTIAAVIGAVIVVSIITLIAKRRKAR